MSEPKTLFPSTSTSSATSGMLDVGGRVFNTFAVVTSGFGGTLEIQGQYPSESTWHRVEYYTYDPETLITTGPSSALIVPPASGTRHYYVIRPWRMLRVVKVHGGGTIGVDYFPQPLDPAFLTGIDSSSAAGNALLQELVNALAATLTTQLEIDGEPIDDLNSMPVHGYVDASLRTGGNSIGTVGLNSAAFDSALKITRPANANAYTAVDVIGGVLIFPNMGPAAGGTIIITSTELEYDVAALPANMANCTLHLYSQSPPSALADNAAWDLPAGDRVMYLGKIALGILVDLGSTLYVQVDSVNVQRKLLSSTLYGYLVTDIGFTPAGNSEVLDVTLHSIAV